MKHKKKAAILIGAPGCGKGDSGNILISEWRAQKFEMSLTLKQMSDQRPEWRRVISDCQQSGALVPDTIALPVIERAFDRFCDSERLLVDGATRTCDQVRCIIPLLLRAEFEVEAFYIDLDLCICQQRMLGRKRGDDTPLVIQHRFDEYLRFTRPAIELLKQTAEDTDGVRFTRIEGTLEALEKARRMMHILSAPQSRQNGDLEHRFQIEPTYLEVAPSRA